MNLSARKQTRSQHQCPGTRAVAIVAGPFPVFVCAAQVHTDAESFSAVRAASCLKYYIRTSLVTFRHPYQNIQSSSSIVLYLVLQRGPFPRKRNPHCLEAPSLRLRACLRPIKSPNCILATLLGVRKPRFTHQHLVHVSICPALQIPTSA